SSSAFYTLSLHDALPIYHVLYSPRTSMRYRDVHPLELPSADGCLEDRSSTHDGQHGGTKAQRGYTTDNPAVGGAYRIVITSGGRSEEHTSELQSRFDLVC